MQTVEFDPRARGIGDRLDLIQKLKKKYGGAIPRSSSSREGGAELEKIERSGEESERLRRR